jgi:hypothetical protein
MSAAPKNISDLIAAFRLGIEGSRRAVLTSQFSALEEHTSHLQQLIPEAADVFGASHPTASQELHELRRELRVYASVLKRASRYVQAELNALALCAHECSYGPGSWTVSAIRDRR